MKIFFIGGKNCRFNTDLTGKIAIVTGANSGIGKYTAFKLADQNAIVIMACRNETKAKNAIIEYQMKIAQKTKESIIQNQKLLFYKLDLNDLYSIKSFVKEFYKNFGQLHILVNNAGLAFLKKKQFTLQGYEKTIGVNHVGHFYLTQLLLPILYQTPQSRIIFVSSIIHERGNIDFESFNLHGKSQKEYNFIMSYANSKFANVLTTKKFSQIVEQENRDVKFVSNHPGLVLTSIQWNLVNNCFLKVLYYVAFPIWWYITVSSEQGAQNNINCCLMPYELLKNGAYYSINLKEKRPSKKAFDQNNIDQLYDITLSQLKKFELNNSIFI